MNRDILIQELIRDEGQKLTAYDDATGQSIKPGTLVKGHVTCGIGRALDVRGISPTESMYLLTNDIDSFEMALKTAFVWYNGLSDVRQRVLCNMAFNMGIGGIHGFTEMLAAIGRQDWDAAANEMQNSAWFHQAGDRAVRLVAMMRLNSV